MVPYAPFRAARRVFSLTILLPVLTTAAVVSSGCDKVPLTAPAGTVITMVATTAVLPLNGSTDIVAVLVENGTTSTGGTGTTTTGSAGTAVHNGTLVQFTTSLGRLEPAEAQTVNGRVTVKLIADGRSGRATVTAFSGSAKQTLEVVIGAAAAERVLVTATPTLLGSTGGTSQITARVEDASGNGLAGVPVSFSTTAGTLSAATSVTSEGGTATVSLSTTAAATVTATAGGKSATAALTLKSASTVSMTVPASITVGAPATFVITPSAGSTLQNVVVNFGDGSTQNLGTISSATSATHFFEDEDIFVVRVTGTDADGAPVQQSGSVAVLGFTISLSASSPNHTLGQVVTFTVSGLPTNVPLDSVIWDFGNGVTRTTDSLSTSYEFPQRGGYTVRARVIPRFGTDRIATVNVNVQ